MSLFSWSRSNVEYGRKLLDSALDGARSGEQGYLEGKPAADLVSESLRKARVPAAIGVCIGVAGSISGDRGRPASRALAYGVLGGAIGFGVGVVWGNRRLAASVAWGAWKKMEKVVDEHWLEQNPIDYA